MSLRTQYANMDLRFSGQNCIFFLSPNSQKKPGLIEKTTKYKASQPS